MNLTKIAKTLNTINKVNPIKRIGMIENDLLNDCERIDIMNYYYEKTMEYNMNDMTYEYDGLSLNTIA